MRCDKGLGVSAVGRLLLGCPPRTPHRPNRISDHSPYCVNLISVKIVIGPFWAVLASWRLRGAIPELPRASPGSRVAFAETYRSYAKKRCLPPEATGNRSQSRNGWQRRREHEWKSLTVVNVKVGCD